MLLNEGNADRVIRVVLAIVLALGAMKLSGALSIIFWVLAAAMLITSAVGFCPLYRVFGISTRK